MLIDDPSGTVTSAATVTPHTVPLVGRLRVAAPALAARAPLVGVAGTGTALPMAP